MLTHKDRLKGARRSAKAAKARALERAADVLPLVQRLRAEGYAFEGIAERLNLEGYKTAQGALWTRTHVYRLLARARPVERKPGPSPAALGNVVKALRSLYATGWKAITYEEIERQIDGLTQTLDKAALLAVAGELAMVMTGKDKASKAAIIRALKRRVIDRKASYERTQFRV